VVHSDCEIESAGSSPTLRGSAKRQIDDGWQQRGHHADVAIRTRAAIHAAASATKGRPAKPFCPAQLGTAVSKKPAIAHAINPYNISCACHKVGGHPEPMGVPAMKLNAHSGTKTTAATPVRKN
jgi:hypothetical protein